MLLLLYTEKNISFIRGRPDAAARGEIPFMYKTEDSPSCQKQGYLQGDFRLFHIREKLPRTYEYHYHDFLKIVFFLEGNVNYIIEGRSYPLCPGDIVLVDRGQIHRPQVSQAALYERLILYLSPDFLDRFSESGSYLGRCFSTAAYRHSNVLRLKDEVRRPALNLLMRLEQSQNWQDEEFAGPLYSRLLCLEFLVELNRASADANAQFLPTGTLDYRVSGLISYINDHLSEDLNIRCLSSVICVSPYHMMRLFKEETGYTIGNYITEKRLLKARSLLSEGAGATQACFLCGFNNYSTFLRAYKHHFNELPKHTGRTLKQASDTL